MRATSMSGLQRFTSSMKTSPGSPHCQAAEQIRSKTSRAGRRSVASPVRGLMKACSPPDSTACMNASVTLTEMLKFSRNPGRVLQRMKSIASAWSTLRMAMFAPRRRPPCLMTLVALSKTSMNEIGPEATPPVERTTSPLGRSREKLNPVPPPDWWMNAMLRSAEKMPSIESSTGSTKQAESWPRSVPAFISVGEFGRNSSEDISA